MGNCLIWISLCMFFFPLIETVTYTCHYMTDRLERFDLKTSKLDLLKKKDTYILDALGVSWYISNFNFKVNYPFKAHFYAYRNAQINLERDALLVGVLALYLGRRPIGLVLNPETLADCCGIVLLNYIHTNTFNTVNRYKNRLHFILIVHFRYSTDYK